MATDAKAEAKEAPAVIRRRDHLPPPFLVPRVLLRVDLAEEETTVNCTLHMQRNPAYADATGHAAEDLVLDADLSAMTVQSVSVNGRPLGDGDFAQDSEKKKLTVPASSLAAAGAGADEPFTLETVNRQRPQDNSKLEGLYKSGGNYCTQMEAQGFRRFAPHLDRPDVLSTYRTVVVGDHSRYPVLLSNGNLVAAGAGAPPSDVLSRHYDEEGTVEETPAGSGNHWTVWEDPWPKPTYLFALVAGNLAVQEGTFTTRSGKVVQLRVFAPEADISKCHHAMESLKTAMDWDERTFGREYDLQRFNIVAVPDFNMGAMENKSLNVFNTKYVLADVGTATDDDFTNVAGVIAHEYCHNYSGNRVTCQDWFQLTLKEGFTVFRDQEFSSDTASRAMKRINDVNALRAGQFPEDAGPMAHPIRPDEVIAIDNFYSATVYNKGAEIVRMYDTLLGRPAFRRATDLYFERHDGQAVTCDDFCTAMEDANWDGLPAPDMSAVRDTPQEGEDPWVDAPYQRTGPRPLTQFRRWYSVAGTPQVTARVAYDADAKTVTITLKQSVPPTSKQPGEKPALHIPIKVGLIGPDGKDLPLQLRADAESWGARWGSRIRAADAGAGAGHHGEGHDVAGSHSVVLHLTEKEQTFVFENVQMPAVDPSATDAAGLPMPTEPVPSLLRGFSAPVRLEVEGETRAQRLFRMAHDSDPFNRWEAANQLATEVILAQIPKPVDRRGAEEAGEDEAAGAGPSNEAQSAFESACRFMLSQVGLGEGETAQVDPKLVADALAMPPMSVIMQECVKRDGCVFPPAVSEAKKAVRQSLARALQPELERVYRAFSTRLQARGYTLAEEDKSLRALRNQCLGLLIAPFQEPADVPGAATGGGAGGAPSGGSVRPVEAAQRQLAEADNMTDELAALHMVVSLPDGHAARQEGISAFFDKWSQEALVMDKWLSAQALSSSTAAVRALLQHPVFNIRNPNKVYSLAMYFAKGNLKSFHDPSGAGYDLLVEVLEQLDPINPQVAARVASAFTVARQLTPELQRAMRPRIRQLLDREGGVSENTYEILQNTLSTLPE